MADAAKRWDLEQSDPSDGEDFQQLTGFDERRGRLAGPRRVVAPVLQIDDELSYGGMQLVPLAGALLAGTLADPPRDALLGGECGFEQLLLCHSPISNDSRLLSLMNFFAFSPRKVAAPESFFAIASSTPAATRSVVISPADFEPMS